MMTRRVTMTRVLTNLVAPALATLLAVAAAHAMFRCAESESLKPAVRKYLEERAILPRKFEWLHRGQQEDRKTGTNNALQMPVLEKLGLVVASDSPAIRASRIILCRKRGRSTTSPSRPSR